MIAFGMTNFLTIQKNEIATPLRYAQGLAMTECCHCDEPHSGRKQSHDCFWYDNLPDCTEKRDRHTLSLRSWARDDRIWSLRRAAQREEAIS